MSVAWYALTLQRSDSFSFWGDLVSHDPASGRPSEPPLLDTELRRWRKQHRGICI